MNNLVSIIVPVYNIEKYINRCIDSIIKQSYKKIEVIIIDDGSTDNSSKIIDNYPQKDSRIKVIHKENGGLSSARNEGMKYASGDFLCFIDGDDYIESTMIEEMMSRSEGKDVIICGFYVDFEKANGKLKKEYKNTLSQEVNVECDDDIKQIEINENLLKTIGYAWNKLYRKQFLEKNNLIFELNLSRIEDTEFNCRVLRKTRKFLILNKAFNHYVQRNRETLGNKKYANQLELDLRLNKCHVELLENWNIPQEMIEKNQKRNYFRIMKTYLNSIKNENKSIIRIEIDKLVNMKEFYKIIKENNYGNIKDKIFIFLLKNKMIYTLKFYYSVLKI